MASEAIDLGSTPGGRTTSSTCLIGVGGPAETVGVMKGGHYAISIGISTHFCFLDSDRAYYFNFRHWIITADHGEPFWTRVGRVRTLNAELLMWMRIVKRRLKSRFKFFGVVFI